MATGQSEPGINLTNLFSREAPDYVQLVRLKVDTMVALEI